MVALAISFGIYSYLILALGLLGWLYPLPVGLISLVFWVLIASWLFHSISISNYSQLFKTFRSDRLISFLLALLGFQVLLNFLGAASPELSFDALWYHLTPAKLYVQNHQIFYIPGWLLWPANIPRLTEMFYTTALLFSDEILAKLIHFAFGILATMALFNLLKRYLSLRLTFLGALTFYTMLMVGWQSTTAYVELVRTFFEILALDSFLQWVETKKESLLWGAAILTGLAIATKILALGTLFTFLILILLLRNREGFKQILKFMVLALLVVSPWLAFSFVHTGHPLFPLFDLTPDFRWLVANLTKMPLFLWQATLAPDDIISPVYLIFLPLLLISIWKQSLSFKMAALYVLLGFLFAPAESNRYLLPYLPGLTLVSLNVFNFRWAKERLINKTLLAIIILAAFLNLGSRALATRKFLPYLLGQESKSEFLTRHLNFSFGDFYDIDGWFVQNIKKDDLVLIYDVHNLYYVDFPYVHESWARSGTYFTHILVGDNKSLPEKFGQRRLLYQNPQTRVKLYLFGERYP